MMICEGQPLDTGRLLATYTTCPDPVLVKLLEETVKLSGLGTVTFNGRYGYRLVNHANRGGRPERNLTRMSGSRAYSSAQH